MSNPDDLTKALAQNGDYDPEKAEEMRTEMAGTFRAAMRRTERYLWGYTCLLSWLGVFAAAHFIQSSTTKALLFYGLLTLAFFETTILMKLWYWITNNKISVLKAIKQLEQGEPAAVDANMPREGKEAQVSLDGLPRWERRIWKVAIFCGCFLVLFVKGLEVQGVEDPWGGGAEWGSLSSEGCVTLAADGSGSEVTEMSFLHQGTLPRRGFDFHAPDGVVVRFADSHGNELPFETSPEHGHVRYIVHLRRPLMPGRRFSYTRTQKQAESATEEGGVWTYSNDVSYGYNTNEFSQTVVLPEGAEIVSTKPWPVSTFTLQGKPTVRFEATRGHNDPFKYTVQYRLAEEASE
jgi:hypothetical protein